MSDHLPSFPRPNLPDRFSEENLLRVQEGTLLDLELSYDTPLAIAQSIQGHYLAMGESQSSVELQRLRRFAQLASYGVDISERKVGTTAIYAGELLALDQGCRITGALVYPSAQIQQTIMRSLKEIHDYQSEVGKLDQNLEPIDVPANASLLQQQRTAQWGSSIFRRATQPIRTESINLTPIQETIVRLTSDLDPKTAAAMQAGFWLVMKHLIEPAELPTITVQSETPAPQHPKDTPNTTYSAAELAQQHPELITDSSAQEATYYILLDELVTHLNYKYFALKAHFLKTHPYDTGDTEATKRIQQALAQRITTILESSIELPLKSSLQVSGEFLYYTKRNDNKVDVGFKPQSDTSYLRGDFAGITIKRAHTQKALNYYTKSLQDSLPDFYEPLMPHIKLENALFISLDHSDHTIETVFDHPVEIPLLYTTVHFSKLTGNQ